MKINIKNTKKWTKGPWEVKNGGDIFGPLGGDSGDGVCADDNDGWQVAEVDKYHAFVDGVLVELGGECRRANLNLIAAAPDLYEALDDLLSQVDQPSAPTWLDLKQARAALAKARGKSHD